MHRLYTGATLLLQCQESSRSILSAIPPVCTRRVRTPLPPVFLRKSVQGSDSKRFAGDPVFKRVRNRMKRLEITFWADEAVNPME